MKKEFVRNRGAALIIIFSVLMVLSVAGVALVRTMVMERGAVHNYSLKVQSRLAALAGIDYAIAELMEQAGTQGFLPPGEPGNRPDWYYPHTPDSDNYPLEVACFNPPDDDPDPDETTSVSCEQGTLTLGSVSLHFSGRLNTGHLTLVHLYSLKIIDMSGQLNLNSHVSASANQTASNYTLFLLARALAKTCGFSAPSAYMAAIGSTEADQVAIAAMGGVNWAAWNHGLGEDDVANANQRLPRRWEHKNALIAAVEDLGLDSDNTQEFLDNVTVDSWIDRSTSKAVINPAPSAPPAYVREARAPININTASEALLIAMVWELQACPVYLDNRPAGGRPKSSDSSDGLSALKEIRDVTCLPTRGAITMFAGSVGNDLNRARNFARDIIRQREDDVNGPFKCWGDFDIFVEGCSTGQLPTDGSDWSSYYAPTGGLGNDVWLQTRKDLIKACFNSNVSDYYFNPGRHARMRAGKSDFFDSTPAPTHRTEFCFFSAGSFEISSLGFVVNLAASAIEATTHLRAQVTLGEIVRHTTQRNFETPVVVGSGNYPNFTNTTTTHPNVMGKGLPTPGYDADDYEGRVESQLTSLPSGGTTYASNFAPPRVSPNPASPITDDLVSNSARFTYLAGGVVPELIPQSTVRATGGIRTSSGTNLAADGLFSHRMQYDTLQNTRFYSISALDNGTTAGARRGMNYPGWASNINNRAGSSGDRVPYYRGALQFWVKLTEPSDAPIACGLFSATLVNRHSPSGAGDPDRYPSETDMFNYDYPTVNTPYSEGVQFYIYKNNDGQLRFSRIYFCLAYDTGGQFIGTHHLKDTDGWNYNIDVYPNASGWTRTTLYFPVPRRDILIPSSSLGWEANTWHRIFIAWNDERGAEDDGGQDDGGMEIWIDGEYQTPHSVQKCQRSTSLDDPEFSLLNEMDPRDCMNICGFFRPQRFSDTGFFKLDSNAVFLPGNATIANVRVYNPSATPSGSLCFVSPAAYTHVLPLGQGGKLGTLCWTAYPARLSATDPYTTVDVRVLDASGTVLGTFSTPASDTQDGYYGEGLPLGQLVVPAGSFLEYTANLYPNSPDRNECPILDDITVTVFRVNMYSLEELY